MTWLMVVWRQINKVPGGQVADGSLQEKLSVRVNVEHSAAILISQWNCSVSLSILLNELDT